MKRYVLSLIFLCVTVTLSVAQVTSIPAFPTETGSVTIRFNASEGNKGLENFAGDVYAHTGVITDKSTGPTDWKFVKGTWGNNATQPKLTRVEGETNLYEFTIDNPRTFYGVPASDKILRLAMVFRSGTQVGGVWREGKGPNATDLFIDIYEEELKVTFVQPSGAFGFYALNEEIDFVGSIGFPGTGDYSLQLFAGETMLTEVNNQEELTYTYTVSNTGRTDFTLVGFNQAGDRDSAFYYIVVNPPQTNEPRPVGLLDGITYTSATSATLILFAPYKDNVYVIGDFNDWAVDPNYLMKKHTTHQDSTWFWITLTGLTPQEEYGFQYLVDGSIRIADPYTHKILDPFHDQFISADTYPNLKPYPSGKTDFQVSMLQTARPEYVWQSTGYQRPPKEELVIYELLIRDFVAKHDFATLIDTLDYLERLGVNAIELMPVQEFEGNESWGYNPAFMFAVDKYYGPDIDFKRFVDECHSRGIAVILDMVLNHQFGQSPLVRLYASGAYGPPTSDNPWFNVNATHPFNVGYDMNHESKVTKEFFKRVVKYWVEEYRVDGYRFDLSKGFTQRNTPNDVNAWSSYDASRVAIWKDYADYMWSVDPQTYVILEHFADWNEERELTNYGMMTWWNMDHPYQEAVMGWNASNNSNFGNIYYKNPNFNNPHLIGYYESHDEERVMYKTAQFGNRITGGYSTRTTDNAVQRVGAANAMFYTIPGPKMLWQFGELGYDVNIDFNGRTGNKPIRWNYLDVPSRLNLYKTTSAIIKLRKAHPAFTSTSSVLDFDLSGDVKRIRINHADMQVSIIANFDIYPRDANANFHSTRVWYDYFTGKELEVTNTQMTINLQPGEFKIYTTLQFDAPEPDITLDLDDDLFGGLPKMFTLEQNYPNPFNPNTTIAFNVPEAAQVSIEVFDALGRKVATLLSNEMRSAGAHTVNFDASRFSSGVYLVRMTAQGKQFVRKMTLLK